MRGVIVEGYTASGGGREGVDEIIVFLELEDGVLSARRGYGVRSPVLHVKLDELEEAIAALKRATPFQRGDDDEGPAE